MDQGEELDNVQEPAAPHVFDRKYFDQFSKVGEQGQQRFEGEVYAPYGLYGELPVEGPPNMDQIWPFLSKLPGGNQINYIGEDWKIDAPPQEQGGVWDYQMPHLQSELIRDVQLIRKLGEGCFGCVWEVIAQHRADTKERWPEDIAEESGQSRQNIEKVRFACKVVQHMSDIRYKKNFMVSINEMLILRYLRDENICNICDIIGIPDRETGFPYAGVCIFFELCNGTLSDIMEKGGITSQSSKKRKLRLLPLNLSKHWFRHTLRGLAYIHENGVTHQDIKEDNILYVREEVPPYTPYQEQFLRSTFKLADFGLSKTEGYYIKQNKQKLYAQQENKDVLGLFSLVLEQRLYEQRKYDDVLDLFSLVLEYSVPDLNRQLYLNDFTLPDDFSDYCQTHEWNEEYPKQWKLIAPELLDLAHKFETQKEISALDVLNHPWLQEKPLSNITRMNLTLSLPPIPEESFDEYQGKLEMPKPFSNITRMNFTPSLPPIPEEPTDEYQGKLEVPKPFSNITRMNFTPSLPPIPEEPTDEYQSEPGMLELLSNPPFHTNSPTIPENGSSDDDQGEPDMSKHSYGL